MEPNFIPLEKFFHFIFHSRQICIYMKDPFLILHNTNNTKHHTNLTLLQSSKSGINSMERKRTKHFK